jgi:glycosyltransferase involved in cell wall biosynthesis
MRRAKAHGLMPTVCLDCRYIGPRPSGIGNVVQALVDHLPGLAPDLDFLLLRHPALDRPLSPLPNVRETVVRAAANGPLSLWLLPRLIDLRGVDLFHAPANILPAGLAMPSITTIHDSMWLNRPQLCNPRLWGQVERRFYANGMRRALRRSRAILTVSEATRADLVALAPDRAAHIVAAPPGVSPAFGPADANTRVAWPRRFILTVGQYAPYKNHHNALAAFARAFPEADGPDLLFVQRRGPDTAGLRAMAAALGVGERVHCLPPVDERQLAALYRGALALLHPSLCEGFGMPVAEAMASGCPVVTSDRSAMPEVAGGAALLADPEDPDAIAAALRRIADDPECAQRLSALGIERARKLDRSQFAAATLAVYRTLLAGG